MNIVINILLIILAFIFMEFIAWFVHKYIMHGFLWPVHKDHHTGEHKPFEWNDLFVVVFSLPGILLVLYGLNEMDYKLWLGIGIILYGMVYFLLHDVLVHRRLRLLDSIDNRYFRAIVKAHNDHHIGRKNYGFILFIPWKYFRNEGKAERGKY